MLNFTMRMKKKDKMKTFLFIGRFVKRKGLIFLAQTWQDVIKKHPDYKLIMVGSGNMQPDSIEDELRSIKNIKIYPETEDTKKYYKKADVFIFPSEKEGLSNVLIEAMSMELPIIATKIGGNTELIENEVTGLLFKPNDKQSLLDAIDNIFTYKSLGKNARKKVELKYSLNVVANKYGRLYERN